MSLVGKKFVLIRMDWTLRAYEDQFGISHDAYVVTDEAIVEVVEERRVPYVWSKGFGIGRRAVDADGNEYFNNWNQFEDASMSPSSYWSNDQGGWDNVTGGRLYTGKPVLAPDRKSLYRVPEV